MLPTDYVYGTWAASGEIDIMEAVNLGTESDASDAEDGELERRVYGTLHYGETWPDNVYSGTNYELPDGESRPMTSTFMRLNGKKVPFAGMLMAFIMPPKHPITGTPSMKTKMAIPLTARVPHPSMNTSTSS